MWGGNPFLQLNEKLLICWFSISSRCCVRCIVLARKKRLRAEQWKGESGYPCMPIRAECLSCARRFHDCVDLFEDFMSSRQRMIYVSNHLHTIYSASARDVCVFSTLCHAQQWNKFSPVNFQKTTTRLAVRMEMTCDPFSLFTRISIVSSQHLSLSLSSEYLGYSLRGCARARRRWWRPETTTNTNIIWDNNVNACSQIKTAVSRFHVTKFLILFSDRIPKLLRVRQLHIWRLFWGFMDRK